MSDHINQASEELSESSEFELSVKDLRPTIQHHSSTSTTEMEPTLVLEPSSDILEAPVEIAVQETTVETHVAENLSDTLVKDFGEFDPRLELANYKFPTFNLLKQYNDSISIDPEELEANKNKILETLQNYKIGISKIKATVGPTITLYEIVPDGFPN